MLKKSSRIYYWLLPFLFVNVSRADVKLTDLFTTDTFLNNSIISFLPTAGMAKPITGIHLHYLTSSDCYSGYAGSFYSAHIPSDYTTSEKIPFSLTSDGAYMTGVSVIRETMITSIHSILIRFVNEEHGNRKTRFAFFIGDCEDQDINCCVPVTCSIQTETCLPQHQFPIQYIFWS